MNAPLDRDFRSGSNGAVVWHPGKLWSLLDMPHSYFPIYQIALDLEALRGTVQTLKEHSRYTSKPSEVTESIAKDFTTLLKTIHQRCLEYGLIDTSDMAKRLLDGVAPDTYAGMFADLNHLNGALGNQLQKEAVFRMPAELKHYYGRDDQWPTHFHLARGTFGRQETAMPSNRKMHAFIIS